MAVHLVHNLLFLCPALRILGALTEMCAKTESYLRHICPPFDLSACPNGITWLSQSKFCEILYWAIWLKFIGEIQFCFKLDENKCHNMWTASQSQWPRGLRRGSAAARLLRSWVWIPPGAWMFVCCECCVLSGRSLCDELITRPEESYRLWCVVVCDLGISRMGAPYIYIWH